MEIFNKSGLSQCAEVPRGGGGTPISPIYGLYRGRGMVFEARLKTDWLKTTRASVCRAFDCFVVLNTKKSCSQPTDNNNPIATIVDITRCHGLLFKCGY